MKMLNTISIIASVALLLGCNGKATTSGESSQPSTTQQPAMQFNADSAFAEVERQCSFGPRVPGTPAHEQCGAYLQEKLMQWCDTVYTQKANLTTFDHKTLHATNYIGVINPDASQRLLLLAHWDCRPWADNDPDPAKHDKAVMGANDAASGVAVLLEVARQLSQNKPGIGVDILLVDAEDWGSDSDESSWALGTQYWAKNPHIEGYRPMYGILIDMVGAKGAQFAQEGFSLQVAQALVNSLWQTAQEAGYGNYFTTRTGGYVTDDHVSLIKAGIACIDVIDMRHDTPSGFFKHWHTTSDTLDQIDRGTLKAVGQTLLHFIYSIQ